MTTLLLLTVQSLANDAESHPEGEPPDEPPHGGGAAQRIDEAHLRDPRCEGPIRGGPTRLADVVKQIMPCRPSGQSAVGVFIAKDLVEPDEHGITGFRLTYGHCERFAGEHGYSRLVDELLTASAAANSNNRIVERCRSSMVVTPRKQEHNREASERRHGAGEGENGGHWGLRCAA